MTKTKYVEALTFYSKPTGLRVIENLQEAYESITTYARLSLSFVYAMSTGRISRKMLERLMDKYPKVDVLRVYTETRQLYADSKIAAMWKKVKPEHARHLGIIPGRDL